MIKRNSNVQLTGLRHDENPKSAIPDSNSTLG